jgi:hypothetical protein
VEAVAVAVAVAPTAVVHLRRTLYLQLLNSPLTTALTAWHCSQMSCSMCVVIRC